MLCSRGLRCAAASAVLATAVAYAQWFPAGREPKMGPLFDQGLARYQTPELKLTLMKSSGIARDHEALATHHDARGT